MKGTKVCAHALDSTLLSPVIAGAGVLQFGGFLVTSDKEDTPTVSLLATTCLLTVCNLIVGRHPQIKTPHPES